uniref:Xylanolytic transcriptional activator regulatory domain-containing protein n=2 Tax=Bionectria ochroleuca TaxID=29856 RepID=A0A0B7KH32_BIOOC
MPSARIFRYNHRATALFLERPALGRDNYAFGLDTDPFASFAFGPKVPKSELLGLLPLKTTREFLFSRYFTYQAPLFHVLHEPTFEQQYAEFTHGSTEPSLPWLALIFVISSLAVQTLGDGDPILRECQPSGSEFDACDPQSLSRHLRKAAIACLSEARFMVRYNLTTLEALLIMIYGICHSEGVDRAWVFLGVALNMGIALRCNANHLNQNRIEQQRRWRCWAGIRLLYTYQGILFHDVDPSFLLAFPSLVPTDEYDFGINGETIRESSTCPSSVSIMKFKLRLFELSTWIGSSLSSSSCFDEATMHRYEALIATEQEQWNSLFLPSGSPSFGDTASYAYWCILETYAHQLYLLIHRPFYHSQSPKFLPSSRENYAKASIALLDIYEKMCELPILRPYRWLVNGMTSFNALQGMIALAACMIDKPGQVDSIASHRVIFDAAVQRIESLHKSSPVCERAFPAIQAIKAQISALIDDECHTPSREWDPNADWLDLNSNDWTFWENFIDDTRQGGF